MRYVDLYGDVSLLLRSIYKIYLIFEQIFQTCKLNIPFIPNPFNFAPGILDLYQV